MASCEKSNDPHRSITGFGGNLGADFGGNATLIGASANVVVAGMSERAGEKISFLRFMAYGVPVTVISLAVATLYVLLRYYW
jgi:Na+/H+ antiporter NhaD/arsenite permease-like protein